MEWSAPPPSQTGTSNLLATKRFVAHQYYALKHLPIRKMGPKYEIPDYKIFNYIVCFLHTGCQWKMLPIAPDQKGHPESHYTRLFRIFQKWNTDVAFLYAFENSVLKLFENGHLDTSVMHGDGTTTTVTNIIMSLDTVYDSKVNRTEGQRS